MATLYRTTNGQYEPLATAESLAEFGKSLKLKWKVSAHEPSRVKTKTMRRLPKPKFQDVDFYADSSVRHRVNSKRGPQGIYKPKQSNVLTSYVKEKSVYPRIDTSLKFNKEDFREPPKTRIVRRLKGGKYKILNPDTPEVTSTPSRTRKPKIPQGYEVKRKVKPFSLTAKERNYHRSTRKMQGTKTVRNTYHSSQSRDVLKTQLQRRRIAKRQLALPNLPSHIRRRAETIYADATKKANRLNKLGARHRVYQGSLSGKSVTRSDYGIEQGRFKFKRPKKSRR